MARHAVVTGASMAGLLAARTLADHVERVTVLERDAFPPLGEGRRGVPQGRHVHGLMARGREILEDLFPGLTRELVARGAPLSDARARGRWFLQGATTTAGRSPAVRRPSWSAAPCWRGRSAPACWPCPTCGPSSGAMRSGW
jgi:2-polyprenyl-6-methoxyphenol hydroxylase-like FAD-dependent oxidoreductase